MPVMQKKNISFFETRCSNVSLFQRNILASAVGNPQRIIGQHAFHNIQPVSLFLLVSDLLVEEACSSQGQRREIKSCFFGLFITQILSTYQSGMVCATGYIEIVIFRDFKCLSAVCACQQAAAKERYEHLLKLVEMYKD